MIPTFAILVGVQNSVQFSGYRLNILVCLETIEQLQVHTRHFTVKGQNLQTHSSSVSLSLTLVPFQQKQTTTTHHVRRSITGKHALRSSHMHHLRINLIQRRRCSRQTAQSVAIFVVQHVQ